MSVPSTVQIGPNKYRIQADTDALTSLRGSSQDVAGSVEEDDCAGMTCAHTQVILVDPTLGPDAFKATLLHEVMHAIADLADLHDEATEEDWCLRGAPYLLDTLRRNADLTAFLLS
jgi:hypothetical protein